MNQTAQMRTPGFGDNAMALDVVMQLTIDLLVQRDPEFGVALRDAIDALLNTDGPSSGTRTMLQSWKAQVSETLA